MPRRCPTGDQLDRLVESQDRLVHARQAIDAGLTRGAIDRRLQDGHWRRLLPSVYLCAHGEPTRRQLLGAALLWAGPEAAVDADDACAFHGLRAVRPDDSVVRIVVPRRSRIRSTGYVLVRRSTAPFEAVSTSFIRYVEPAAAVVAAARLRTDERRVLAILSDAVQRRIAPPDELMRAHLAGSPRNAALTELALRHLGAGVHSAPEGEFRRLAETSRSLPRLLYNAVLRLPGGRLVSPDALALDAGLVHETNGRAGHARADLFEHMQERHDAMTAAGLVVLHNSGSRIYRQGARVLAEFEQCYARLAGRGLPPGVELLTTSADFRTSRFDNPR